MHRETLRALLGTAEEPELVFRRGYDAPSDQVMDALRDPERLARWFGRIEGEPRAVGDPFVAQLSDDPDDRAEGHVLACTSDTVSVSWSWQDEPESVLTARVVERAKGGTDLVLHHVLSETRNAPGYGGGWESTLDSLALALDEAGTSEDQDKLEATAATAWRERIELPMVLHRGFDAPLATVWAAFASAEGLRRWWWTHTADVTIEADVRVNGSYRIAAPSMGSVIVEGIYLAVAENSRLAFTWIWSDEGGASPADAVDIRFTETSTGTEVTIRHTGPWTEAEQMQDWSAGWSDTLDSLTETLRR